MKTIAAAILVVSLTACAVSTPREYDAEGNRIQQIDTLGNVTTYTYDERGQLLTETNPIGTVSEYEWDEHGNLVRSTACTCSAGQFTSYTYDDSGNQISETDALGRATTYAYDAKAEIQRGILAQLMKMNEKLERIAVALEKQANVKPPKKGAK